MLTMWLTVMMVVVVALCKVTELVQKVTKPLGALLANLQAKDILNDTGDKVMAREVMKSYANSTKIEPESIGVKTKAKVKKQGLAAKPRKTKITSKCM